MFLITGKKHRIQQQKAEKIKSIKSLEFHNLLQWFLPSAGNFYLEA